MEKIPTSFDQTPQEKEREAGDEKIPWQRSQFNLNKSEKEEYLDIELQGSKEFRDKMKDALLFLQLAPEKFSFSKEYVKKIEQWDKTGMNMFKKEPTFELGKLWEESDSIYLASGIAHEAYHSYLCSESEDKTGKISPESFTGKEAEKKCLTFQIETLKEMGQDEYMQQYKLIIKEHIENLEELLQNPTYQDIPYEKRDW